MQEFHINRNVRDRYHFDQSLFELDGNVVFANLQAVRKFVRTINSQLDPIVATEKNITASQVNALGLIDEILHFVFAQYRQQINPAALQLAYQDLNQQIGSDLLANTLIQFCQEFPPLAVYRKEITLENYLASETNKLSTLEEIILLWLSNRNPAFMQYGEFFDDSILTKTSVYPAIMTRLETFFATQPAFGPDNQDILTMLQTPAIISPHSLEGQLKFIRSHWGNLVQKFLMRILGGMDLIKEETKAIFGGPGPTHIPDYDALRKMVDLELERFSPDSDWMPRLVLIAKNSYVWLFQLSQKYGREIRHLDQIPNEELDALSRAGITGLWLIGLWERSKASESIKKMCGNPEAVASAYSILDYRIASDLGGEDALHNFKERAWQRGIRLASDMVPNHMGIDSTWVIDHPEYFISLNETPYPAYSFNGPNLSPDGRVGIYLEDHYYNRTDAAVVFKRVDHQNGQVKYLYHGNDGTTMPWNDTAQLNYLSPQVREEVIQLILRVARDFPVIRFDAAMTLAKKHFQRLWFPEPGFGGAIPSRSEHAISLQDFQNAIPEEFWREVVDRVAREVPDTLLLAEAFWLMESYFVRTLGMHRVYNSAFMNMLRNEENAKYRSLMKNTLEFDPEILKRFVNFMNNPDERTAVDQFGKGDKYFGICIMMVTLPGLPMFGHGQIEGYTEKYGMEYRRAYLDEHPDQDLIARHEREIFPVSHQRYLFTGVEHFCLYDFFLENGRVDEDVYAYSNGHNGRRALVIFQNKFANTHGWIRTSTAVLNKSTNPPHLQQKTLGDGLALHNDGWHYVILHDQVNDLETLYRCSELFHKGIFFQLGAYACHVFTSIQEVEEDENGSWARLYGEIGGKPVRDIFHMLRLLRFRAFHQAARDLFSVPFNIQQGDDVELLTILDFPHELDAALLKVHPLVEQFLTGFCQVANLPMDRIPVAAHAMGNALEIYLQLVYNQPPAPYICSTTWQQSANQTHKWLRDEQNRLPFFIWSCLHQLHLLVPSGSPETSRAWMDEYVLNEPIQEVLCQAGMPEDQIHEIVADIFIAIRQQDELLLYADTPADYLSTLFADGESSRLLGVNRSGDTLWYRKEALEAWMEWLQGITCNRANTLTTVTWSEKLEQYVKAVDMVDIIRKAIPVSDYKVERLLEMCKKAICNGKS